MELPGRGLWDFSPTRHGNPAADTAASTAVVAPVSRAKLESICQVHLKCLRSHGGSYAFGLGGEVHDHTVPVLQLGMHLTFDQGESAADASVGPGKLGEVI